jgi:hypothetical protein
MRGAAPATTADDAALGHWHAISTQNRRLWVRLREKGGKAHAMPCRHNLETYIAAYIEGAGLADDPKGPLFRTIGRGTGLLTRTLRATHRLATLGEGGRSDHDPYSSTEPTPLNRA